VIVVTIHFADCVLDLETRRLIRDGHEAHLSPKAFDVLKLLVENRPRVLTKTELIERVWPGVFVSDASLAKAVSRIRQAIGQEDDTRIVRTVHGCGYAFAAALESEKADLPSADAVDRVACWLFCGRREFPLREGEHIVGRESDASVRLDSPKVSRRHAKVVVDGTRTTLIDLGSKNGSFVRGVRISDPTILESGDDIRIGPFALIFRSADGARSTETEMR
jgi:DNA-binding winged helix-turn-helix (wHTH) protein